jgi:hypothetical protein
MLGVLIDQFPKLAAFRAAAAAPKTVIALRYRR